jgi:hypothetical protein
MGLSLNVFESTLLQLLPGPGPITTPQEEYTWKQLVFFQLQRACRKQGTLANFSAWCASSNLI